MGKEALSEALEGVRRDEFEDGDVVRWLSGGRYQYAALKTPVGWFTTARVMPEHAQRVPQVVTFEQLIKLLQKSEVTRVEFADSWEPIA